MKQTLLEICQDIASSMGSDEFNSIGDSTESLQIANCVKQTYFNMVAKYDLPEHNQLFQLDGSNDSTMPVLMYRPDGISRFEWIKYFNSNPADSSGTVSGHAVNTDIITSPPAWSTTSTSSVTVGTGTQTFTVQTGLTITVGDHVSVISGITEMIGTVTSYDTNSGVLVLNVTKAAGSGTFTSWIISENTGVFGPGYRDIDIVSLEQFLEWTNRYNLSDDNVGSFQLTVNNVHSGVPQKFSFNFRSDAQPRMCCVISDYFLVFDSYDDTQDSSLQSSKTLCFGWVSPAWTATDDFTPVLDENMFPMLLNESKSLAFFELKQQPHQKAEVEINRQRSSLQKFKNVAERPSYFDALPNFGRRGGGTGR